MGIKTIDIKNLVLQLNIETGKGVPPDATQAENLINQINDAINNLECSPIIFTSAISSSNIEVQIPDEYMEIADCIENGTHLTDCDGDGFCNFCGKQESTPGEFEQ